VPVSASRRGLVLMSSENKMINIEDLENLPPEVVESLGEVS